jgi:integrase
VVDHPGEERRGHTMPKSKKYLGVYFMEGKKGISYGIDYIHPQTGQRVRKVLKNVTSEAQAYGIRSIEIADAARGAIDKAYGLKPKERAVSFESMVKAYLKWSKENKESWGTDEHRAKHLKRIFAGRFLSDINPFLIEKYKSIRAKEKGRQTKKLISKKTINKELILGGQIYKKAIEWEKYNGENPFLKASRYKIKKPKKPGSLSPEDVQAIMGQIGHEVKRDMVLFDFNTGWRISEIRKLRWEDVNQETGLAWIVDPKNGNSVEIELNDQALEIIKRQRKRSKFVFCHKNGKPFKTNLHRLIKNAAKNAGVNLPPRKAWHIFRRTWASMMLQNGCDVETLRELGNWKDHSMPLYYADAAGRKRRREMLNNLPVIEEKGHGRILAEISEGDNLTSLKNG